MIIFKKIKALGKDSCYIINNDKKKEDVAVKIFIKKELVSSYNRLVIANKIGYYANLKPINYAQTIRLERVTIDSILLEFDRKTIEDISEEKQKELKDMFEDAIEVYEEEAKAFPHIEA